MTRTRAAVAFALVAIVAYSFALRWQLLSATPFPTGIDGYFYPVQLRALLAHGHLAYPASPFAFWFMAPFAAATDPITGAKLGAAIGGALIALPAYALGVRLGRRWGAGVLAAAMAAFSAGSTYLTVEYVKNGIGLTVALTALWLVLRALELPSRRRVLSMVLGLVATLLAHKMAAALVIAIAVPAALVDAIAHGRLRGRRLIYVILGGGLALIAVFAIGAVAPRRFLSAEDLRLVRGLFGDAPTWDALATKHFALHMGNEALTGGIIAIAAAVALVLRGKLAPAERCVAWALIGLAIFIAFPYLAVDDPQGLGFRIRLIAFLPRALAAAVLVGALPLPDLERPVGGPRWGLQPKDLIGAALAVLFAIVAERDTRIDGEIVAHPALVTSALALQGRIPPGDTAIVPERHIAFMIAWYAEVSVSLRPDPIPRDHRWRVLPLSFIGLGSPLDDALMAARAEPGLVAPIGLHPRHPDGMVLVAEPTWEWVLDRLEPAPRKHYLAWPTI